jgi:glutamyl-tRNA synthetase
MHLGNARTALLAWLDARARGGRIVLRMEDLDRSRSRAGLADALREDLAWLGLDWDEETAAQSTRDDAYAAAVGELEARGLVYPCFCTRRELGAASAPHGAPPRYPGTCRRLTEEERDRRIAEGRRSALRVRMAPDAVTVTDRLHGAVSSVPDDVVVRRSDGLYAYQLAVVVDDAADGVTDVVRGDDLLPSTPSQAALGGLLGLPEPRWGHVPLGEAGRRVSRR